MTHAATISHATRRVQMRVQRKMACKMMSRLIYTLFCHGHAIYADAEMMPRHDLRRTITCRYFRYCYAEDADSR